MERTGEGGARELELLTHALALDAWWQGSERATEALLLRAARLEQQRLRADKSEDRELFMQLAGAPGSLIALSRLYEEKGREADAERILREGRSFMEGVVGDQSEAMIPILLRLADHYASRKHPAEAIAHLRSVQRIEDEKDGHYFETRAAQVKAELKAGRYEAALKTASSVLDEARRLPDPVGRETSEMAILLQLAMAHRMLGRHADAILPAQRLAALFDKYAEMDAYKALFASAHAEMAQLRAELAHGYLALGRIQDAWRELHRAAGIMQEVNLKRIGRRTSDQPHKLGEEDQVVALIDKGEPEEAHPSYWAPFVVVGEGAARR